MIKSRETTEKRRESMRRYWANLTPADREKQIEANKMTHSTPEYKAKQRQMLHDYWSKPHPEVKAKMAQKRREYWSKQHSKLSRFIKWLTGKRIQIICSE